MAQKLSEWDRDTAPHLGRIEECIMRAHYYLGQAIIAMEALKERPNFRTRVEDTLESLEHKAREAIVAYQAIPKDKQ